MENFQRENIIERVVLEFHTAADPKLIPILEPIINDSNDQSNSPNLIYDFGLFPNDSNIKFGILQVKIADTPILKDHQVLDTSNDMSGSMEDQCSDGKTKMQHAKHTLKNIITAISKMCDASVTMATYGFDDKVETIFEDTKITQDTAETLRHNLDKLQPRGGTDIYKSLEMQSKRCKARHEINPRIRQTNITLTDGQTNQGKSTVYSEIATQVAPNCTNVFIGFGNDHNATGLQQLADAQKNGSYFYVAEIEKAGLVFGEIIHQMLYTALTNVTIKVENAEIYDYKTNTWKDELFVPSIVSEATKTYHVRSATPDNVVVTIYACSSIHNEDKPSLISKDNTRLPSLMTIETDIVIPTDLSIYMLRQRAQELIFKAHRHSVASNKMNFKDYADLSNTIRKELINYCKFMQQFSKENNLEQDDLLKTLIADVLVVAKTFGGPRAALYSLAKSSSQGRQTSNNTSYINPQDIAYRRQAFNKMRRQNAISVFKQNLDEPNETDDFDMVDDILEDLSFLPTLMRTTTTPKQIKMMRACSNDVQDLDDKDNLICEGNKSLLFSDTDADADADADADTNTSSTQSEDSQKVTWSDSV
jgi:hypothetical protein